MEKAVSISLKNVVKSYKLYDKHSDRVKETFHPFRKKYHRNFNALTDINLEVKKGETVGIIGQNGSGKSTLLQIACGILKPTSGNVEVDGRVSALLELGAGFNPEFSGAQNVYINASILGLTPDQIKNRFNDIIAFADIGDFIEQPVRTYSSGMVVRLAFAVIVHVDAQVLIIDEALAVGDASYVQKCMRFIRSFCQNGTLFFVSHDTQSILDLCDRAIWLDHGKIRIDGKARDVVREYNAFTHSIVISDESIQVHHNSNIGITNENFQTVDHRKEKLISSVHRNIFEIFSFDFNSPWWGKGGAHINNLELLNLNGEQIRVTEGAELVEIRIHCKASVEIKKPIIGFSIRNQRGLELISENTYLTYRETLPPAFLPGESFYASFKFMLPYLKPGNYTIGGAIADGTQFDYIQHHRRDEAMHFKVHASHIIHGLFGLPLMECSIKKVETKILT